MVIAFPLASFTAFDTLPSAVEEASCRPTAQKPTKRPKKWHIWPRLRRRLPRAVSKKQPSARTPGEQVHGKIFFAPPGDCSRAGDGWHSASGARTGSISQSSSLHHRPLPSWRRDRPDRPTLWGSPSAPLEPIGGAAEPWRCRRRAWHECRRHGATRWLYRRHRACFLFVDPSRRCAVPAPRLLR